MISVISFMTVMFGGITVYIMFWGMCDMVINGIMSAVQGYDIDFETGYGVNG